LAKPTTSFPLYNRVKKKTTLHKAWQVVRENGLSSKSYQTRNEIKAFDALAFQDIERISRELHRGGFKFHPSHGILLKRRGKGPRPVVLSPVPNRIVQRAVLDVLQLHSPLRPYYLNPGSFGGIAGQGVRDALQAVYEAIKKGARYYVRSDIIDFFTCIPRKQVLDTISAVISDPRFRDLLDQATNSELDNLADLGTKAAAFPIYELGVAQGFCLSPIMGNILLSEFDKHMNARGITCVRYIDDFVLLGRKPSHVRAAFDSAQTLLSEHGLRVHDPDVKTGKAAAGQVRRGLQFLGCEVYPGFIRPSKKARQTLLEKLEAILIESEHRMSNPLSLVSERATYVETLMAASDVVRGWGNQYSFCNDNNVLRDLDDKIDARLRQYRARYRAAVRKLDPARARIDKRRLFGVHL